jgi:hypothetical protein
LGPPFHWRNGCDDQRHGTVRGYIMSDLLISAKTVDEFGANHRLLTRILECVCGWVGRFDEDNLIGDLEVRLLSHRATDNELVATWERVKAGEEPGIAWETVKGPSYEHAVNGGTVEMRRMASRAPGEP